MNRLGQILLVDDNEDDYEALRRSCCRWQLVNRLEWCRSGEEAWDHVRNFRVDLILLDLDLPGMDGRQLLKLIKADLQLCLTPVVVFTASGEDTDIRDCYGMGVSTYVQKPVGFDSLTAVVETIGDYWFNLALLPVDRSKQLRKKLPVEHRSKAD